MGDGLFARFHMKTLQRMIAAYEKERDFATGQGGEDSLVNWLVEWQ
jgi:hypothetical protein